MAVVVICRCLDHLFCHQSPQILNQQNHSAQHITTPTSRPLLTAVTTSTSTTTTIQTVRKYLTDFFSIFFLMPSCFLQRQNKGPGTFPEMPRVSLVSLRNSDANITVTSVKSVIVYPTRNRNALYIKRRCGGECFNENPPRNSHLKLKRKSHRCKFVDFVVV